MKEIIDDLTPKPEKKPNSLLDFLKSNARKLAPLVLLASAITGGSKLYQSSVGDDGGSEVVSMSGEISPQAQAQRDYFQNSRKEMLDRIDNEHLNPAFSLDKGIVLGWDEKGQQKDSGTIDIKAFPGDKYGDGTKVETIAKLPIGTLIDGRIINQGSESKSDKVKSYMEFSCNSVNGDFHDPKVEEKIIQLDENTICVVPWINVASH